MRAKHIILLPDIGRPVHVNSNVRRCITRDVVELSMLVCAKRDIYTLLQQEYSIAELDFLLMDYAESVNTGESEPKEGCCRIFDVLVNFGRVAGVYGIFVNAKHDKAKLKLLNRMVVSPGIHFGKNIRIQSFKELQELFYTKLNNLGEECKQMFAHI